jgi:tetratricopeptide (TPR) repeat protein
MHIEEALKLHIRALPDDHVRLGTLYGCRAAIHHDLGDLEEALDDYDRTLLIYKKFPVKLNLARVYNNMGLIWMDKGNHEISVIMYQKAHALIRDHSSTQPECKDLNATILQNIGQICGKYGQEGAELALLLTNKALELCLEYLSTDHPRLGTLYSQIASIYDDKENYDTALNFYQRALDIQLNSEAFEHNNVAAIYSNMAVAYENKNELEQALITYQKAMDLLERKSAIHSDVSVLCLNMSSLYHRLNKTDEALDYAKKALDIARKTLLDDHQIINMCNIWLKKIVNDNDSTSDSEDNEQDI